MRLTKLRKLYIQLTLTVILFFTELVIGYLVKSIALVADAFHMLNDVVSLVIAVYAVKLAEDTRYNPRYSYGLQRAEVVGALINAVLLLGLCLTIVLEAVPRFFEPVEIQHPELVLIVGSIGLVFNVVGMFLFGHNHGHSHGHDHGHGHEQGHSHEHKHNHVYKPSNEDSDDCSDDNSDHFHHDESIEIKATLSKSKSKSKSHSHDHGALNMKGVYLHVLGDAMASLAVIVSALIIWLADFEERFLFDPIISIVITLLIIRFTLPLIKSASVILMQGVPNSVPLDEVRDKIMDLEGILGVHEFHIWQLSDTKMVGSVHVILDPLRYSQFAPLAIQIQTIMHRYDVHSITIQPESFIPPSLNSDPSEPPLADNVIIPISHPLPCQLLCSTTCGEHRCCPDSPPLSP